MGCGHRSVETTEGYLGSRQRIMHAVKDKLGIEPYAPAQHLGLYTSIGVGNSMAVHHKLGQAAGAEGKHGKCISRNILLLRVCR